MKGERVEAAGGGRVIGESVGVSVAEDYSLFVFGTLCPGCSFTSSHKGGYVSVATVSATVSSPSTKNRKLSCH